MFWLAFEKASPFLVNPLSLLENDLCCLHSTTGKKNTIAMGNGESRLAEETGLSKSQIDALYDKYLALAQCSPTDLRTMPLDKKLFVSKFPPSQSVLAETIFDALDDGRGVISFRKFVLCVCVLNDGTLDEKTHFAYRLYDREKKGYIAKNDIVRILQSLHASSQKLLDVLHVEKDARMDEKVSLLLQSLHADSLGRVHEEDFYSFCREHPVVFEQLTAVFSALKCASMWDWEPNRAGGGLRAEVCFVM